MKMKRGSTKECKNWSDVQQNVSKNRGSLEDVLKTKRYAKNEMMLTGKIRRIELDSSICFGKMK